MAEEKKKGGGGKCAKADRNRPWCKAYKARNQREVNKLKKLNRHLRSFPDDKVAQAAVARSIGISLVIRQAFSRWAKAVKTPVVLKGL